MCGTEVGGEDLDGLVGAVLNHIREAHPDLELTEGNVREYLEAEDRLSDATERLDEIGAVEIYPVTPGRLDDFLAFFDLDAFAGNPAWAGCYCMCHHVEGADWPARRAAENRADMCDRIRARDGHPDDRVGCVVCFAVAPPYRRHGLASRLLDAALKSFRSRWVVVAEAHPRRETQGDAGAYHGPPDLYLSRGFREVASNGNVVTVQKVLSAP